MINDGARLMAQAGPYPTASIGHIELSFDNITYYASTGSLKDRPPEDLSWDELNKDDWSADFDCLKRAKESCIWAILNKEEQAEAIASLSPYDGIFDRENYDDQS